MSLSAPLDDMRADTVPGRCISCDTYLPSDGQESFPWGAAHDPRKLLCGDADCIRLYMRVYMMGYRAKLAAREHDPKPKGNATTVSKAVQLTFSLPPWV